MLSAKQHRLFDDPGIPVVFALVSVNAQLAPRSVTL